MTLALRDEWEQCLPEFLDDEGFVMEAVSRTVSFPSLIWAGFPHFIRDLYAINPKVVLQLVEKAPFLLATAQFKHLQNCESFIIKCIESNAGCINYIGDLRGKEAVVGAAIGMNPRWLEFAGDFCDNEKTVWQAVTHDVTTFKYASKRLRGDKELALFCIEREPSVAAHATAKVLARLRRDKWKEDPLFREWARLHGL